MDEVKEAPGPKQIITRQQLRAMRRQERLGFLWDLPSGEGQVHVRLVSITDHMQLGAMPEQIQADLIEAIVIVESDEFQEQIDQEDATAYMVGIRESGELADAICVAGFIRPRLVLREEEVDESDPECCWVGDLNSDDRRAFLTMCRRAEARQAAALAPFLAEPETALPDRPAEPAIYAAIRPVGIDPSGV